MYKFIIVDDEHLIRKGILKKIEALNLEIQFAGEAENGEDAVELIAKVHPHIVLTDMRMPLMDGKMLLRKLQQDFPSIKTIVISGYSDFEYLQEAISSHAADYILKPFNREEIHNALKKAIASIEKDLSAHRMVESIEAENEQVKYMTDLKYLSDLIITQQSNYDPSYLKSKRTTLIKNCKGYILITIYSPEKNSEALYLDLLNYSENLENLLFIPGPVKQNSCFILYTIKEVPKFSISCPIKSEINIISEYLKAQKHDNFCIGISSVNCGLSTLHSAYMEAVSSLEKRDLHSNERICIYDKSSVYPSDINWNSIDKFIFFIESGNVFKVKELLANFFSELDQVSPLNLISVKFNCQLIFNRVIDMLQGYYDIFNNYTFSSKYERLMNNTFDLETIKTHLEQLLVNITSLLKEKNVYSSNEIIENIKKYIQKNYNQDITLEKISEMFFINPSYFSNLFKEKTGENFSDYYNNIRIEKAKDLLKNTDYKVYKIAKMLGYDNDKYFFRIFKKSTGYTPEGYRENFAYTKINN